MVNSFINIMPKKGQIKIVEAKNKGAPLIAIIGLFLLTWYFMWDVSNSLGNKIDVASWNLTNKIDNTRREIIDQMESDIGKIYGLIGREHGRALVEEEIKKVPNNVNAEISPELLKDFNDAVSRLNRYKLVQIIEESNIPLNLKEYNKIGVMYYNSKKYDEAINYFETAKRLDPNFYNAYNNLGITYNQLGKFDKAIIYLERALEINPGNIDALNNLGWTLNGLKRYDEAEEVLNEVIEKDSEYKEVYVNLSWTYGKQKHYDKALEVLNKAVKIDPNYLIARLNLACIYSLRGNADGAIENLKKAVDLGFKDYKKIEKDTDYDFIRNDPRYIEIINELKKK